jgi:3-phenylpropionate/trans-cinnamate dioxygenase ferredoxin subunit
MPEVRVGTVSEFPEGELKAIDSPELGEIAVTQLAGRFYAIDNYCTHAGVKLAGEMGDLEGRYVTCLAHDSRFDVRNGRVMGGPAYEPLATYPVRIDGNDVYVEKS